MAEKIRADDEPSIEEILDSIRQIISEDDKQDPVKSAASPVTLTLPEADDDFDTFEADAEKSSADDFDKDFDTLDTPEDEQDDDVFELTEKIDVEAVFEKPETLPLAPPPKIPMSKTEEPPFVVDLIDESDKNETVSINEPSVKSEPVNTPPPSSVAEVSILTEAAENAAFSAIAALARRTAVEHSGITIEEIVRTELKPLLRVWLDKNLPAVIERLMREELERVTKRVLED